MSVAGGVVYVSAMSKTKTTDTPVSGTPALMEKSPVIQEDMQGNIFDLIKKGKALSCKFSSSEQRSEGEVYVLGSKIRGNFTMDDGAGTMLKSHMVSDGEYVYLWGDAMEQGIKMKYSELDVEKARTNENLKALNDTYNYDCDEWAVIDSYFVAPSDITFTDMTALQEMMKTNDRSEVDMCLSCNVIPDEAAKQECLANFKCAQ